MNLYEINKEILNCVKLDGEDGKVVNTETGEVIDLAALDALKLERDTKIENIALWIKDLNSKSDAINNEILALQYRAKAAKNKADQLKSWLTANMQPGKKFETPKCVIGWHKSTSVNIINLREIPKEFMRIVPASAAPDKVAIKAAIKKGTAVAGAELKENQSLQIK